PPRLPSFPYTTLFRSQHHRRLELARMAHRFPRSLCQRCQLLLRNLPVRRRGQLPILPAVLQAAQGDVHRVDVAAVTVQEHQPLRSEEHTSELQSLTNL